MEPTAPGDDGTRAMRALFAPSEAVRRIGASISVEDNLGDPPDPDEPGDPDPNDVFDRDAGAALFWHAMGASDLRWTVRQCAAACLLETRAHRAGRRHDVGVLFASDGEVAGLNARWRGRDRPTNVLSWPGADLAPGEAPPEHLGDLAFAYGTIEREADERSTPIIDYLAVLAVHGILHCLGHDHPSDAEADAMEALEARVLQHLGLPDPYAGDGSATGEADSVTD